MQKIQDGRHWKLKRPYLTPIRLTTLCNTSLPMFFGLRNTFTELITLDMGEVMDPEIALSLKEAANIGNSNFSLSLL